MNGWMMGPPPQQQPQPQAQAGPPGPRWDLSTQRSWAKVGMAVSLGTLVYSGFQGRKATGLHIGAGVALIGFSFWHYSLYPSRDRRWQGQ